MDMISTGRQVLWLQAAVILGVALMILVVWGMQSANERRLRTDIGNSLQMVLRQTEQALHIWHENQEQGATIWAAHDEVTASTAELLELPPTRRALERTPVQGLLRSQLSKSLEIRGYEGFSIVSAEGINLASERDAALGQASTVPATLLEKAFDGESGTSLPQISLTALRKRPGGRTLMFSAAPIRDAEGAGG